MLGRISSFYHRTSSIFTQKNKVCSSLSYLSSTKFCTVFPIDSAPFSASSHKISDTHLKSPSVNHCNVGKIVSLKFSSLLSIEKADNFSVSTASVNELLLRISHVCPEIVRKCLRVCSWKPEHVCDLLLGCRKSGFDARVVECLGEIFRRVGDCNEGFKHLPKSFEVLGSMLVNVGMFREAESLLSEAERRGILLASDEIFSGLIEEYVHAGELERALVMYDKIKGRSLVLSLSCYPSIVDGLVKEREVERVISVYEDVVGVGFEFGDAATRNLETVIGFLCWDGKIKEARKLLRKIVATGWRPSTVILSEVANAYCEKRDFEEVLNFYLEMKCAPDILVGNKVIHLLCSWFSIDRADSYLWELEQLGFSPNERTFGIFISFCCRDGRLRDAFSYLSDIFSRGLKPDKHSYNALISSLFKAGMKEHARDILNDMIENGINPDLATFRVLLAGYWEVRQFNDVKLLINEMTNSGLIHLSPLEDPLRKAFRVLGLDPLTVKVKRDNDVRNFRAEFADELGNGLYLDTNMVEFEKTLAGVLEEALVPDFNLLLMRQCGNENVEELLLKVDDMVQWGQDLSPPVLSAVVSSLSDSSCHIKAMPGPLYNMSQLFSRLEHETLNLLIQTLCKRDFIEKGVLLFDEVHRRHLPITNVTYNSVLIGLCKLGRLKDIVGYLDLSGEGSWLPEWRNVVVVLDSLCEKGMLKEVLEFFDIMMTSDPDSQKEVCDLFLHKLCSAGFTSMGHNLINELRQKYELDHTVYGHLIRGYCEERRFAQAVMIFDKYLDENLPLSADVISNMVPILCKANRFQQAVALKDTALREHPSIAYSIYSALVNGFCKAGRVRETDDLILEMLSVRPSNEVYGALLQGHCRNSDLKTAKEMFCFMIRRRINLPLSAYGEMLSLLCRKGMLHCAQGLKKLMLLGHNVSCSVLYNIFIFHLFQTGNHTHVNALLDELEGTGLQLDEVGHNYLVHGFSVCNDMQRSIRYLNDMINKGLRPSNRSLRAVTSYLCSTGQVQKPLEFSNLIESRGWHICSTVHYVILDGLLSDGRILEAERIVAQSPEKGLISDTICHNKFIRKFGEYGRLETAVNLLDKILNRRSEPESSSYDCIVQRFCDFNNLDRAMDFLTEMLHRNLKPSLDTWDLLIEKFCIRGYTAEADGLLISMVKVGETPTKRMYSSVIDRCRLDNNLPNASEVLHRMQQHGYEPDFTTQWSLISSLSNSGDRKGAHQGFLSRLLGGSGFLTGNRTKSNR